MTVVCHKEGCNRTWPRHPALEVACSDCLAEVGKQCQRPSGHSAPFHKVRKIRAEAEGHFGVCPEGRCFEDPVKLKAAQAAYDLANQPENPSDRQSRFSF